MQRLKTPERRDPFADIGSRIIFEFAGTCFLCLCYALVEPENRAVALAAGVTSVVYAGAHVSGGHCNPAVTVATWITGRQEQNFANTVFYVGTQIAAAVAASKVAHLLALVEPGTAGSSCAAPYPQVPAEAGLSSTTTSTLPLPGGTSEPGEGGAWTEFFDEASGSPYFWNEATNETSWERPPFYTSSNGSGEGDGGEPCSKDSVTSKVADRARGKGSSGSGSE